MLFNFHAHVRGIQPVLDSLVAVAQVDQEDVVATKDLETTLSDHGNLP